MKKAILFFTVTLLFSTILTGCGIDLNRLGAEKYYVQVKGDGDKKDDGRQDIYDYTLTGFNEDGEEATLEFFALKELRKDAYLILYYKDKKGVTSYQEVNEEDIPEKALEKLQEGVK
ncbi:uncharacterized protein (TIGR01655 family) [Lederbergia galactosidilyticus]|uniref:Uncharacterized protein n=1 Tax=Lederbergia galactosidilytica TaxID=217031 RepID=A0A0Q9Y3X5_9BACI|nr:YxeA family protein [Lederbergia galactosidilytica]KRG15744.1 hypothetical protein ACA29_05090 [Lederbergia galactosidilytica]MBP1915788.1 uncharacterized protein (TIGR01655 family) [Lederbergia galactosidilytica]